MPHSKDFFKIILGIFVSQVGSHFLTLTVASFVFVESKSAVLSSLVFVATFLPSIFFSAKLGSFADNTVSKKMLIRIELFSILATCLTGAALILSAPMWFLCITLSLRALIGMFGRSLVNKWIKIISPPEIQAKRFKLYSFSYFLSTAISGILAGLILGNSGIGLVVIIDIISFLLSAGIYFTLIDIQFHPKNEVKDSISVTNLSTIKEIFAIPKIRNAFFFVVLSQALFQGAYSALVSFLPINSFGTGVEGVGYFQVAASVGIIVGFLILWFIPTFLTDNNWRFPLRTYTFFLLGVLALVASVSSSSFSASIIFFGSMNLAYEAIWLHHNADFFRSSPRASSARFNFTLTAAASLMMSMTTLIYAISIESLGLTSGVLCVISLALVVGSFKILKPLLNLENHPRV